MTPAQLAYESAARLLASIDAAIVRDGAEGNPRVMAWRAREAVRVLNLKRRAREWK